jgi:chaperonin GroES
MNLRPLHDRVLVKRLEEQETKRGGIIIPDSAKEKPQHAEVVAVGSGKLLEDGNRARRTSKPATRFCSANTRAPISGSTATNI